MTGLPARRFEFVPLWGMQVFLVYAPRRVSCSRCGVKVERMPWAVGKSPMTESFAWFLDEWAKRLSWKEVAEVLHSNWDTVFRAVEMAVSWGRAHLDLTGIQSIGIDEIAWQKGHRYLTLVYQIDRHCKRLLWIGEKRTVKTLLRFFRWLGRERSANLRFICSDMWKPYLKVIAKKAQQSLHVLDRFHIIAHLSQAIDEVRAQEVRELKTKGEEPVLTKTRWLLLKRPQHLTLKNRAAGSPNCCGITSDFLISASDLVKMPESGLALFLTDLPSHHFDSPHSSCVRHDAHLCPAARYGSRK